MVAQELEQELLSQAQEQVEVLEEEQLPHCSSQLNADWLTQRMV